MFTALLALLSLSAFAQDDEFGLWTSVEARKKLADGLNASVEGEFRTQDGFDVERWAATAKIAYKLNNYLKFDGGYTFIYRNVPGEITKKGNIVDSYWSTRHRLFVAATGSIKWNRLEFSLRERFQFTQRTATSAAKWDGDDGSQKADEEILAKSKNTLRSRFQVEWDIRRSHFSPYASAELYNSLDNGFELEKTRWTVGTGYKFSKKHSVDIFYRYQNQSDDDEPNGHVIGLGYCFKF